MLVSSGGLGKEVHPVLRAGALPGSELVLPLIAPSWAIGAGAAVAEFLGDSACKAGPDLAEAARGYASLADRDARDGVRAHTAGGNRPRGPAGERDRPSLPGRAASHPADLGHATTRSSRSGHGRAARKRIPGSRLVEFPGAGHWPQLDDPDRFVAELSDFVESTEPYEFDLEHMREMLGRGPVARVAKA